MSTSYTFVRWMGGLDNMTKQQLQSYINTGIIYKIIKHKIYIIKLN